MKKQLLAALCAVVVIGVMGMVPLGAAERPGREYADPYVSYRTDEIAFTLDGSPATTRWKLQFVYQEDFDFVDWECYCDRREMGFIDVKPWTAGTSVRFKTDPKLYAKIPPKIYNDDFPDDPEEVDSFIEHTTWWWNVVIERDGVLYRRSVFDMVTRGSNSWPAEFQAEYPTAVPDTFAVTGPTQLDVLANDWYRADDYFEGPHVASTFSVPDDPASFTEYPSGVLNPRHGSLIADGDTLLYAPEPGYVGTDTFDYLLWDRGSEDESAPSYARVTVKVEKSSPPPPLEKVSFVGGTASTGRDTPFVDRLTAAGYTVTRFDDDTVTPAQVDGTLVIVSSSVVPDAIQTFVRGLDERVVTWEPYLAAELKMAGAQNNEEEIVAASSPPPNRFRITAHPITDGIADDSVLATGEGRWSTIHHPGAYLQPATLETVGSLNSPSSKNVGTIAVITAPTTRVMLPWTYQNQHTLTAAGWKLFDQAVTWAATP